MNTLDKIFQYIFPERALRRHIARNRLKMLENFKSDKREFESIEGGRMRYDMGFLSKSADNAISGSIDKLRKHMRWLEYNNGFVSGIIWRIVDYTVGQGFKFQSKVKADVGKPQNLTAITERRANEFNEKVERNFARWSKKSDVRLLQRFEDQCRLVQATLIRDGEVLIVGRQSKREDRLIPYCLDVMEADHLATPPDEIRNPDIRNGIKFDSEGAPEKYYILKRHPGDAINVMGMKSADYEEVPAFNPNGTRKVIHLYYPIRPEQTRGFMRLASSLKDLQDLDRYREAEIYAALEDACLTGFIYTENPQTFQPNYTETSGETDYDRVHEFAPGKIHYLRNGEKIQISKPSRPNDQFGEMTKQLLTGPALALGTPLEILSQDWRQMNYSNARTIFMMLYLYCRIQVEMLKRYFADVVYENFLNDLVVHGKVNAPGFDMRREDWTQPKWIPIVKQDWIDPLKEAKGKDTALKANFDTLTDIFAAKGEDVDEALDKRARELKMMQELEKKYGIQFPQNMGGKTGAIFQ